MYINENKNSGGLLILHICQFNGESAEIQCHAESEYYLRLEMFETIYLCFHTNELRVKFSVTGELLILIVENFASIILCGSNADEIFSSKNVFRHVL